MRSPLLQHKQLQIATENRLFRDLINDALPEENRRPVPEPLLPLEITKSKPKEGFLMRLDTFLRQ